MNEDLEAELYEDEIAAWLHLSDEEEAFLRDYDEEAYNRDLMDGEWE
jgi:hypothetical protein